MIGNWDAPGARRDPRTAFTYLNPDGALGDLSYSVTADELAQPENLLAPRSYHYTAQYEREIGNSMSVGIQYVHKETSRLVGWSILGGRYESIQWADPYNGNPITLLNEVEKPTLVKGNHPGDFPGAPQDYEQTYDGLVLTFAARDAGRWNIQSSYTLSRSEGLISRPWFQSQNNPFYGSSTGQDPDPNSYMNAYQRLQGDRPHMFRVQGVLFLPWDTLLAVNLNMESGKPFSRQIRASGVTNQRAQNFIVEPAGSRDGLRHPFLRVVDLRLGKRFDFGDVTLKVDAYLYNLMNSTASISMTSLRLETPGEDFIPSAWVEPRRLMILGGIVF